MRLRGCGVLAKGYMAMGKVSNSNSSVGFFSDGFILVYRGNEKGWEMGSKEEDASNVGCDSLFRKIRGR